MVVDDDTTELPIDGVLDLHTFSPDDVKDLVTDYLAECRVRGICEVRIIHETRSAAYSERSAIGPVGQPVAPVERGEILDLAAAPAASIGSAACPARRACSVIKPIVGDESALTA